MNIDSEAVSEGYGDGDKEADRDIVTDADPTAVAVACTDCVIDADIVIETDGVPDSRTDCVMDGEIVIETDGVSEL